MRPGFSPQPEPGDCTLCLEAGGLIVWSDTCWRVIRVEDPDFPAFYRVISRHHVSEFTDLDELGRLRCMELVGAVEQVLRRHLSPTSINLAALGNVVPHLHWHVIARFDWDSHFPEPIWGRPQRKVSPPASSRIAVPLRELDTAVELAAESVGRPRNS